MNNQTPSVPTEKVVDMSPFKRLVTTIGTLPGAFTESLTYYEALAYFVKYLEETVIPAINQNAQATKELQSLFVELKSYVDNYFDNLDVQTEINNKLDDMAESGQLAGIIAQFLELAPVFGYSTIANMAAAENLSNGCIAKVLGKTNLATGDGDFYYIRTRTQADEPDSVNLVAFTNDSTIIAQRIPNYYANTLQTEIDTIDAQLADELIVFGDSWSDLNVSDARWSQVAATQLHLTLHNFAVDGAGFIEPSGNLISTQIASYLNDNTYNKSKARFIVVLGGVNDYNNSVTLSDLSAEIVSQLNILNTACTNAKVLFVNNYDYPMSAAQSAYWNTIFTNLSTTSRVSLFNQEGLYDRSLINSTDYHLTVNGQYLMGKNICAKLTGGDVINYNQIHNYDDEDISFNVYTSRIGDKVFFRVNGLWKTNITSKTGYMVIPWGDMFGGVQGGVAQTFDNHVIDLYADHFVIARNLTNTNERFTFTFMNKINNLSMPVITA